MKNSKFLSASFCDICGSRYFLFSTNKMHGPSYLSRSEAKRINSIRLTCGTYDAAGVEALDRFTTRTGWSVF